MINQGTAIRLCIPNTERGKELYDTQKKHAYTLLGALPFGQGWHIVSIHQDRNTDRLLPVRIEPRHMCSDI